MLSPLADRLSDRHFKAIAELVETRTGIKLPAAKRTMVEGRLRRRVRALKLSTLGQYGSHLFERSGLQEELVHLIDCVTTNKTDFFREPSHFDFLRNVAVPSLLSDNKGKTRNVKIWSSASSSGAEAYTIAMVMEELVAAGAPMNYSILGTDISTAILKEARAAIYARDFADPVPASMRMKYLMESRDAHKPLVRVVPELRARCRFEHLNLMNASYPFDSDVDVIFCRNVLIYFDQETQAAVIGRLVSHMRIGGYLLLGHSESMAGGVRQTLRQVQPTVFQRVDA
jgi:chemotaxis protein methyltransferase CheR